MADDVEKYEGEWKDGKRHGKGIYTWPDGGKYDGEWEDGEIHGQGILVLSDGYTEEGEFSDNELIIGTVTWPNGEKAFLDGSKGFSSIVEGEDGNGKGFKQYPDGSSYSGEWKDGEYQGHGTFIHSDGSLEKAQWHEGKKQGEGKVLQVNGISYEGNFENDKRHGRGYYRIPGRSMYEGEWINDKKHGKGKVEYGKSMGRIAEIYISGEWEEDEFCSGTVVIESTKKYGDIAHIMYDRVKKDFDRNEYAKLIKDTENTIKQIIRQMIDSKNPLLKKYGELISNGDNHKINKFKIMPSVDVRSFAVTYMFRDNTIEESKAETVTPKIMFNPFVIKVQHDETIRGSLAHEAAHVDKGHLDAKHRFDAEGRIKDYNLSNIADDLIINEELKQAGIRLSPDHMAQNALFLDDSSQIQDRRSWRQIIRDEWDEEIMEKGLTEERIYEALIKKRSEFRWNV